MEELQSTETLEREILEDARKKAQRILKTAEESVKTAAETWALKTDADTREVRTHYAQRLLTMKHELVSRLILDKRRIRAEKIEELLKTAMESYLLSLSREALLAILEEALRRRLDLLRKTGEFEELKEFHVYSCNLSEEELEAILNRNLPQGKRSLSAQESGKPDLLRDARFPVILISAVDLRIAASIDTLAEQILEDKRTELVRSLLGEGGEKILIEGGAI